MAEPEEVDIESTPESTPSPESDLPVEVQGKTPAEIWKMVQNERARADENVKARTRAESLAQEIAMAALDRRSATPDPTPAASLEPDRENDPEGWISFQVKRQVEAHVKPFVEGYGRDRQMVIGGMVDQAKARVAAQFPDYFKHAEAINEFVKNYPADVIAQPGALEEAYYRVKGRAVAQQELEAGIRAQAGLDPGGRFASGERRETPKLSSEQLRVAEGLGVAETEYSMTEGGGAVSIDDYLAAKAKAKGGNHATR